MYRIGIDIGGTNIAAGLVDQEHRLLSKISIKTQAERDQLEVAHDVAESAKIAADAAGISLDQVSGIGIGSPGICHQDLGLVKYANNLNWRNLPICQIVSDETGLPAKVNNDVNCAALGEVAAGAARGVKNAVLVALGTGVGAGIVIDGKIYSGSDGAGGEFGHTTLIFEGEKCTCGRRGCIEAYASATALIRQAKNAGMKEPLDGLTIYQAAMAGDETANKVIDRFCTYLGAGITDLINLLSPEVILIGGGLSGFGDRLINPVKDYAKAHIYGGAYRTCPEIKTAELGNDAGIIGAAALVL